MILKMITEGRKQIQKANSILSEKCYCGSLLHDKNGDCKRCNRRVL